MLDMICAHSDPQNQQARKKARRALRGRCSDASGRQAENLVRMCVEAKGWQFQAARWRCAAGELDLVYRDGPEYVVLEVKSAKDFDTALQRITPRQVARIYQAAELYLAQTPEGGFARVRFDAALVDRFGRVSIIKNALLMH